LTLQYLRSMVVDLWDLRSLRLSGKPWAHGQAVVDALTAEMGIRRRIRVRVHERVRSPMTYGFLSPTILLPADTPTEQGDKLSRAMIHELEHVRRGDWLSKCVAKIVCACYWFNPLVVVAE